MTPILLTCNSIPVRISTYLEYRLGLELIYPFPNFNGEAFDVCTTYGRYHSYEIMIQPVHASLTWYWFNLLMKFMWNWCNFIWIWYIVNIKCIWTSQEIHMNICLIQIPSKIHMNFIRIFTKFIWNANEFRMKFIWTYVWCNISYGFNKFRWSLHEL